MSRLEALVVFLLVCSWCARSAQAADDDFRMWATGVVSGEIGEDFSGTVFIQARFREDISDLERLILRPSVTLSLPRGFDATLGYDAHFIGSPNDTVEHRAWQELGGGWRLFGSDTHAQFRLEERFIEGLGGPALRGRLRAGFALPLASSGWSFEANNEVLWNLTSHGNGPEAGFDQNRSFIGLGKSLPGSVRLVVGYLLQYVDRDGGSDAANHTLAVTVRFTP